MTSVPEEDEDRGHEADSDDSSSQSSESGSGSGNRRHSSGSSLVEALDEEESLKLAECLDYILNIVGDTYPELLGECFDENNLHGSGSEFHVFPQQC